MVYVAGWYSDGDAARLPVDMRSVQPSRINLGPICKAPASTVRTELVCIGKLSFDRSRGTGVVLRLDNLD